VEQLPASRNHRLHPRQEPESFMVTHVRVLAAPRPPAWSIRERVANVSGFTLAAAMRQPWPESRRSGAHGDNGKTALRSFWRAVAPAARPLTLSDHRSAS
jgi:hypothetical protein